MSAVLDMAMWRARLRAETQPPVPQPPQLSADELLNIANTSRISTRAKRLNTLAAYNAAIVDVVRLHCETPLSAIELHRLDLVARRNRLARRSGRGESMTDVFGGVAS